MAKSRKPKQPADTNPPELSFEDSLAELQRIVEELEQGELGLEESMRRFEQGIAFLRGCYKTLEEAEQKIEILTGTDEQGNPLTEPFDATATIDQKKTSAGRRKRTASKDESAEAVDSESDETDPDQRLF